MDYWTSEKNQCLLIENVQKSFPILPGTITYIPNISCIRVLSALPVQKKCFFTMLKQDQCLLSVWAASTIATIAAIIQARVESLSLYCGHKVDNNKPSRLSRDRLGWRLGFLAHLPYSLVDLNSPASVAAHDELIYGMVDRINKPPEKQTDSVFPFLIIMSK